MSVPYTPNQKAYLDTVPGWAHQSALDIIGRLDAELAALRAVVAKGIYGDRRERFGNHHLDEMTRAECDLIADIEAALETAP